MTIKTIPFIKGDGVGPEVTAASQAILNAAIEKAYKGQKKLKYNWCSDKPVLK